MQKLNEMLALNMKSHTSRLRRVLVLQEWGFSTHTKNPEDHKLPKIPLIRIIGYRWIFNFSTFLPNKLLQSNLPMWEQIWDKCFQILIGDVGRFADTIAKNFVKVLQCM